MVRRFKLFMRTGQAYRWRACRGSDVFFSRRLDRVSREQGSVLRDSLSPTGHVIVETFRKLKFDPREHSAVLVASHGPFTWGQDAAGAGHNAVVLEFIARLASETLRLNPGVQPLSAALLDKHFLRKHGPKATYGQS